MAIDRKACFQKQLLDISNETDKLSTDVDDLDERVTALEQGGGGGGGDVPANMVTTNTNQTISGEKTFTANITLGTGIDIDGGQSNTLYIGYIYENGTDISDKYATKTETEEALSEKLDIYKHFDDDDNPEDYHIKQPQTYGAGIELQAARDDNHHPDYSNLTVSPTRVMMLANSANHGDNDDDYTGSIEVTDGYVSLEVTDGEDTTTLQIGSNSAKLNNVQIATFDDIPTLAGLTVYNYRIKIDNRYIYTCSIPYVLDTTMTGITAIRKIPNYSQIFDLTDKKTGSIIHDGQGMWIYFADGTTAYIWFVDSHTAVVEANQPANWTNS